MALYMGAIILFGEEEDDVFQQRNEVMRIARRNLPRDMSDPFSISDNEFQKLYR